MSYQAVDAVLKESAATKPGLRLYLIVLAHHADENGENSFPSLATLRDKTGLSERTLYRCQREAVELGEIQKVGKEGRATSWKLRYPSLRMQLGKSVSETKKSCQSKSESLTAEIGNPDSRNSQKNQLIASNSAQAPQAKEGEAKEGEEKEAPSLESSSTAKAAQPLSTARNSLGGGASDPEPMTAKQSEALQTICTREGYAFDPSWTKGEASQVISYVDGKAPSPGHLKPASERELARQKKARESDDPFISWLLLQSFDEEEDEGDKRAFCHFQLIIPHGGGYTGDLDEFEKFLATLPEDTDPDYWLGAFREVRTRYTNS